MAAGFWLMSESLPGALCFQSVTNRSLIPRGESFQRRVKDLQKALPCLLYLSPGKGAVKVALGPVLNAQHLDLQDILRAGVSIEPWTSQPLSPVLGF